MYHTKYNEQKGIEIIAARKRDRETESQTTKAKRKEWMTMLEVIVWCDVAFVVNGAVTV